MEETKEEIIKESIKRGYINGTKIDNSNFYGGAGEITITNDKSYEYSKWRDEPGYYLRVGGDKVYSNGKWAKILVLSENYMPNNENLMESIEIW